MKKLFLISSFVGCMTLISQAQINKMYKTTSTPTTLTKTTNNVRTVSTNSVVNNLVASYQGMINISPDINSKMQMEWQASTAQYGGNHLKAELWTVTYQRDPKKPNSTEIILQQRVGSVNPSYQTVTGGISYSIGSLPASNNLVVIAYCDPLKSAPGLVIKGKPDDGSVQTRQTIFHSYESNARAKLGQNIIYGICSIVPGKTDLNHLDFNFFMPGNIQAQSLLSDVVDDITGVASKVIDGVTYYFDQVYNGVTGLAKLVINGALDIDGFFINETGEIFYAVGGGLINFVAFGNLPKVRDIRQSEYDWANKEIFNGALPDIARIKIFNFMKPGSRNFYTWPSPTGSEIYMNIGDAYDDPLDYNANNNYPLPGQVFIHELSHAWQINKYGAADMVVRYFSGGGTDQNYDPDSTNGTINSSFNLEQQATLVDRTFAQVYYDRIGKWSCPRFQRQWVEINVRNGVKFDVNKIKATIAMQKKANDLSSFVGTVQGDAVFSKGNRSDGSGYYMQGSVPGSFLYYDTLDKKAYANWGPIRKKYEALGVEFGFMSWPSDDEKPTPKKPGFYQYFKGGVIYYSPSSTTAYYLSGPIFTKWKEQGYENGKLGFPISDPVTTGSGNGPKLVTTLRTSATQTFERGELFMQTTSTSFAANPESSAPVHVIYNNILMIWNSTLGFPLSDQVSMPEKRTSNFVLGQTIPAFDSVACQNATIYWSNNFGAHVVKGEILNAYRSLGASASALGLPASDQLKPTGNTNSNLNKMSILPGHIDDCYQEFQGGTINYTGGKIDVQSKVKPIQNIQNQNMIKKIGH